MSLKSLPYTMISDNASTYQSAVEELKQLFESVSLKESLSRQVSNSYLNVHHGMAAFGNALLALP